MQKWLTSPMLGYILQPCL